MSTAIHIGLHQHMVLVKEHGEGCASAQRHEVERHTQVLQCGADSLWFTYHARRLCAEHMHTKGNQTKRVPLEQLSTLALTLTLTLTLSMTLTPTLAPNT